MILKGTILSAFTDRGTLLKWLKKVETALHDSTLTDISIDQISETQVKLKFTFENGSFVESPVLTLPRGEKGDKGDKGDTGATGATGATPNISVTATELPTGSSPTATRSGTDENPLITFGIPDGKQLYHHSVGIVTDDNTNVQIPVYSSQSEAFNVETFHNYFPGPAGMMTFGIYRPNISNNTARIINNIGVGEDINSIAFAYLDESSNIIFTNKTIRDIEDIVKPL